MSTSTNRQSPPPPVTRNSFNLTSNPFLLSKTARPKSSTLRQRRSKTGPRHPTIREQHQDRQQQQLENIPLDTSNPALQDIVIYIDKSVINRNSLTGMANALAATVLDKWTTSVTHLIHGSIAQHPQQQRQQHSQQNSLSKRPQGHRTPPIISKSLEKKMRVVSPAWLTACYNNKERMPESIYPYEMNSHRRMTSLRHDPSMDSAAEENPFGLEPDEFATIESCDEEHDDEGAPVANDRRVTDYFQPTNNNSRNGDNSTRDDQQDGLYTEAQHLDFDDDNNFNNGEIIQAGDNDKLHNTNIKDSINDNDNEHAAEISYSLIEMSQVQPEQLQQYNDIPQAPSQQQQQQQQAYAYEGTSVGGNQVFKVGSWKPPTTASVERSIQQMVAMDDGSQTAPHNNNHSTTQEPSVKIDEDYGDYDLDDNATSLSALPDLDPNRQPKVTLGREDRLQIWYGEQSFCLDAGMPLSRQRDEPVDLTNSDLPPQEPNGHSSTPAPSALRLSTIKSPTTTKRLKKSHR